MAAIIESSPEDGITVEIPSQRKKDILFFLLLLLLLAGFAILLLQDIRHSRGAASGEAVAKLLFRKNRVERKVGGQVIWSGIGALNQIYNYDSIRTEDGSLARVSLDNGTELALHGSALVTIVIDNKKLSLDLTDGNLASFSTPEGVEAEIKTGRGILELEGGSTASILQSDDGIQIDVLDGGAEFVSARGGATKIGKAQSLIQGADGEIKVERIPFLVILPQPSSLKLVFDDSAPIQFLWESTKFTARILEISKRRDFTNTTKTYQVNSPNSFKIDMGEGTWYWRIGDGSQVSSPSVFSIVRDKRPDPLSPSIEQKFFYIDQPPLIRLQWQKSDNAALYNVEVNSESLPDQAVIKMTAQNSSISLDSLPEGKYSWEVEGIFSSFDNLRIKGGSSWFQVVKFDANNVPEPEITIDDDGRISQFALQNKGILLTWDEVGELNNYNTIIYRDTHIVKEEVVSANSIELPKKLASGEYRIQVSALNNGKAVSSQEHSFIVQEFGSLEISTPQNDARYFDIDPVIHFRWHDSNRGDSYLLEVSRVQDFSQVLVKQKLSSAFISVPTFAIGTYYSRVHLLDPDGKKLVTSQVRSFQVERKLQVAPVMTGPVSSGSVDLTVFGTLNFQWSAVPKAELYRLTITPQSLPLAARSWDVVGLRKEEFDVLTLPLGQYSYALVALGQEDGKEFPISDTASGSFELQRSRVQKVTQIEIS